MRTYTERTTTVTVIGDVATRTACQARGRATTTVRVTGDVATRTASQIRECRTTTVKVTVAPLARHVK